MVDDHDHVIIWKKRLFTFLGYVGHNLGQGVLFHSFSLVKVMVFGYVFEHSESLDSQNNTNFIANLEKLIYDMTYSISTVH
jgi:hypothetical protein